ncbi:n-substituted formamide deformylase precursor [Oceanobacillus picturae]|uniref:N-substituted formamide deformylase n=2 Tax=Oceanobacillus picturae TaxID=171693 RepID=A0A0U9H8U6_9BACI|nr:amidohydrolase [Oceanobacillus picturae]GAQ19074.1 n-substituted formamide deformylase precursor [Oceanobacillus picturae]
MMTIDLVIKNATILTMDENFSRAGSLTVKDGRVDQVWETAEPPEALLGTIDTSQVIDLKGKTVVPGFVDTHSHLLMYSQFRDQANCSSPLNQSISDILEKLRAQLEKVNEDEWVLGWGYDNTLLKENRHPTRKELDQVSTEVPIFIRHTSVHFAVANSKALELAGLTDDTKNPKGGHFGKDEDGKLDGVLYELPALEPVQAAIPTPSISDMADLLGEGAKDYLAEGITTCSDAGVGLDLGMAEYEAHLKAVKEAKHPLRMRLMVLHHLLSGAFKEKNAETLNKEIQVATEGRAVLDSAKLFQDGSIQGFTAALREPYYTKPEEYGELLRDQEEFEEELLDLHNRGFRLTIHGNGDKAIESILDAYSFVLNKNPRAHHLHRIEHLQTALPTDLDRMKELDVAGSFFINHVYYWADRHKKYFLGPERTARINPLADASERDILYTLHSDCPITPISPLFSIWAAVNRQTMDGEILGEDQCISVEKALQTMTIDGAKLNADEANSGSLEAGKLADFAILDQDPTAVDKMAIKNIMVLETYIGGERVYRKEG